MREVEQVQSDIGTEGVPRSAGTLVVLSERLGLVARASLWIRAELEGQLLVAVPSLRLEHVSAMMIAGGTGLNVVFHDIKLVAPEWEEISGFVGGSWMMWKTGRPELQGAGFVLGSPKFDIERAVRGITKLLT